MTKLAAVFIPPAQMAWRRADHVFARDGRDIEMEASYIRGRLSVDEYLKQCAIVNPHLQLHYRVQLTKQEEKNGDAGMPHRAGRRHGSPLRGRADTAPARNQPHVELGMLMAMLKDTSSRTLQGAVAGFLKGQPQGGKEICERANLSPVARPEHIARGAGLYKAISETNLMRPPTDCSRQSAKNRSSPV